MEKEKNEMIEENEIDVVKEKKSTMGIIIPLLVAVLVFGLVYGGFMVVEHLNGDNKVSQNENDLKDSEENQVKENDNNNLSSDTENQNIGGTTGEEIPIEITDAMKNELNDIASIKSRYCTTERIFYSMNGFLKDLPLERKKFILIDYYYLHNSGLNTISEASYKAIAAKYEFSESFDTFFAGLEKQGNNYVLPPMGCTGPEVVSHNLTYADTGNTITVIDNVTITNQETNQFETLKVIYTFIYSGEGSNITFRLHQINHEKN